MKFNPTRDPEKRSSQSGDRDVRCDAHYPATRMWLVRAPRQPLLGVAVPSEPRTRALGACEEDRDTRVPHRAALSQAAVLARKVKGVSLVSGLASRLLAPLRGGGGRARLLTPLPAVGEKSWRGREWWEWGTGSCRVVSQGPPRTVDLIPFLPSWKHCHPPTQVSLCFCTWSSKVRDASQG